MCLILNDVAGSYLYAAINLQFYNTAQIFGWIGGRGLIDGLLLFPLMSCGIAMALPNLCDLLIRQPIPQGEKA
jgi:hypothetical protein